MRYRMEKFGVYFLGFLVARCELFGLYPFAVPFFMATYLQDRSSISLLFVLLAGVLSKMAPVAALQYGITIVFLMVLLKRTDRKNLFETSLQHAMLSGVMLCAIAMPYQYIVTGDELSLLYAILDGVIAGCSTIIFEKAIEALKVGTERRFASNERFVGLFAMVTIAFFGCPQIEEPIHLLFVLTSLTLLYYTYRFGGSVGVAMGSATGIVLAFRQGEITYLAVMVVLSGMLVLLRELGKVGILLSYLAGIILLGILYEPTLLSESIISSALIVSAVFLMLPTSMMRRVFLKRERQALSSQDVLVQEATKERIKDFGEAFFVMEKMLLMHEEDRQAFEPHGLSNVYLSGDGISLLNAVESQSNRLAELRRNFIRQLGQIGSVITDFQGELLDETVSVERFESRIRNKLSFIGVEVAQSVVMHNKEGRLMVYLRCSMGDAQIVTGKMLAGYVSQVLGKRMICVGKGDEAVGEAYCIFTFAQEGNYMLTTGVVRKKRDGEKLCGDNFSVTKLDSQKAVLMLSDGMGYGENASLKSEQLVELLEQLLESGFYKEMAIELLNSCISFLAEGTISSTLDLTMIDFYTGKADFIKLGASTTFIKRGARVECIRSTSLPVGVLEQIEFDTCERKLYHGDIIIMISDGVLDGIIFENKEAYLADLIASINSTNVQVVAETIMEDVVSMQQKGLRDDSTILAAGFWERA